MMGMKVDLSHIVHAPTATLSAAEVCCKELLPYGSTITIKRCSCIFTRALHTTYLSSVSG